LPAHSLGLIAGSDRLPLELARSARDAGRHVVGLGFRELTDPALEGEVDDLVWLQLGQLDALLEALRGARLREVVMAGKVPKLLLFERGERVRPDARALRLVERLDHRADDAILSAIAAELEREGIRLLPQAALAPGLLAEPGPLGRIQPTEDQLREIAYAWPIAKGLAGLDIGQTVVVRDRAVLAVEAIDGTDATIRRGGELARGSACVVKVAKPRQDPRFDLPAIGLGTVESLAAAEVPVMAVEAGQTLVLERRALVERADAHGIALVGIEATGPQGLRAPPI